MRVIFAGVRGKVGNMGGDMLEWEWGDDKKS